MYIIKLNNKSFKINSLDLEKTYEFSPKNDKMLDHFWIYDNISLQKILIKKYLIAYKRLVKLIESNDDDSDEFFIICLNEISKLKDTLEYKYKKYLKKSIYEKFINDLVLYDKYVQNKIVALNYEEKGRKGR